MSEDYASMDKTQLISMIHFLEKRDEASKKETEELKELYRKKLRTWISRPALDDDVDTQQVRRYGEVKFKEPIVNAFVEMCKIVKKPNTSVCIYDSDQRKYIFKFE